MEALRLISPPDCRAFYGATLPRGDYRYPMTDRWGFHCYFSTGELSIGDYSYRIEPGTVSITPINMPAVYHVNDGFSYIYSHFIPENGLATHRIPLFTHVGKEMISASERGAMLFYLDPVRSRAVLWEILLSLCFEREKEVGEKEHSWVEEAIRLIGNDQTCSLNLDQLSAVLGISSAQLNRLFKKKTGQTVYQYILGERTKRVRYLIEQTAIPLKQIALETGYGDLQKFNKHCRLYLGGSPRELRENVGNRGK